MHFDSLAVSSVFNKASFYIDIVIFCTLLQHKYLRATIHTEAHVPSLTSSDCINYNLPKWFKIWDTFGCHKNSHIGKDENEYLGYRLHICVLHMFSNCLHRCRVRSLCAAYLCPLVATWFLRLVSSMAPETMVTLRHLMQ